MENNKICPLLSITSEDNLTDCYGESCAWYVPPVYASNGKLITKGVVPFMAWALCRSLCERWRDCELLPDMPHLRGLPRPVRAVRLARNEKEAAASATNTDSGRVETGLQALLSVSSLHENKEDCKDEEA